MGRFNGNGWVKSGDTKQCRGPSCDRTCRSRYCRSHQAQLRKRGDAALLTPLRVFNHSGDPCRCGKPGVLMSPWGWLCVAHHARWKKCGDPQFQIPVKDQRPKGQGLSRRAIFLSNRYRITLEGYEAVLEQQDGRCALCHSDHPKGKGKGVFSVDHDHGCLHERFDPTASLAGCPDCVRGLLCDDCNQNVLPSIERGLALGLCELTQSLADYLASRPFSAPPGRNDVV